MYVQSAVSACPLVLAKFYVLIVMFCKYRQRTSNWLAGPLSQALLQDQLLGAISGATGSPATKRSMQMAKRSTLRTPTVEKRIIEGLCDGTPLRELCRQDGMPNWRTVYLWTETDPDFAAQVARARDTGTDAIAEQALDLIDAEPARVDGRVDPGHVQWKRAQVDTRLKLLACWNPKKYGSKQTVDVGNKDGEALKVESNAAEIAANVAAALRAAKRDA